MADGPHGDSLKVLPMKALVVGCGSIGRRHIQNLINSEKIDQIIIVTQYADCEDSFESTGKTVFVNSLDGVHADFAVVANDTNKHIATALNLAEKGIHVLVEKPLSHNLDNIARLKTAVSKKTKVLVGYNMRFLGIMQHIKEQLLQGVLGELYFAKIEVGQYLPHWRSGQDYRKSYSVHAPRGGGVALDLSHELDYMRYLFSEPVRWKTMKTKTGPLEMDAESMFEGTYLFHNNFICNTHMDCLQKVAKRSLRIEGARGSLMCDFMGKVLTVSTDKGVTILNDKNLFNMEQTYWDELNHFIDVIEHDAEPAVTLDDGAAVLRLIEDSAE